jgi:hypothetical protein
MASLTTVSNLLDVNVPPAVGIVQGIEIENVPVHGLLGVGHVSKIK